MTVASLKPKLQAVRHIFVATFRKGAFRHHSLKCVSNLSWCAFLLWFSGRSRKRKLCYLLKGSLTWQSRPHKPSKVTNLLGQLKFKLVWCSVKSALAELAQLHTARAEETWEQTLSIWCRKRVWIWSVCYDCKIECVCRERERENEGGMAYPAYPCLGSTHIHFQPCHQKGNHTMPRRCKLFGPEADSMLQSKVREEKGIHNYNEPPCFELLWPPSTEDGWREATWSLYWA